MSQIQNMGYPTGQTASCLQQINSTKKMKTGSEGERTVLV